MNAKVGVLAGIARPIPDVATFVTPIFSGSDGNYFIQEVSNDVVVDFQPVVLGEEFQEFVNGVRVQLGDPAMYGFETLEGRFLIGEARPLAAALAEDVHSSPSVNSSRPHTVSAIRRFIDFVLHLSADHRPVSRGLWRFSKSPEEDKFVASEVFVDFSTLEMTEWFAQQSADHGYLSSATTMTNAESQSSSLVAESERRTRRLRLLTREVREKLREVSRSREVRADTGQLTRDALIDVVSKSTSISEGEVGQVLDGVVAAIKESLRNGGVVALAGLGTFYVGKRSARVGRDPLTGAPIRVRSSKVAKFRPDKKLKDAAN